MVIKHIVIRSMMGGYLVYLNGKLIGDICDNELFLKRTPTSDRLLEDSELRYPYEESKTLMHVFDRFEDAALVLELLDGMYKELPEKKKDNAFLSLMSVFRAGEIRDDAFFDKVLGEIADEEFKGCMAALAVKP